MKLNNKVFAGLLFLLVIVMVSSFNMVVAEAGSLPEERKIREIELITTTADYDPIRYEMGLTIAEYWEELGFDVKLTPMEFNRLADQCVIKKEYDTFVVRLGSRPDRLDPTFFLWEHLHSSMAKKSGGYRNYPGYINPEYDKLADAQRSETDVAKRQELVYQMQELFARDQPLVPILHRNQIMPYNSRDFENVIPMLGEGLNSFWNWLNITPTGERKVVVWGYPSDVASLNPLDVNRLHRNQTLSLIYDTLVKFGEGGEAVSWAAEKLEYLDDTTLEIKLRPGMKFHDGEEVTTEDVDFSFRFVEEVNSPSMAHAVKPIEKIEIVDDLTMRLYLDKPNASFFANTLSQVFILPEHIWSKKLEELGAAGILDWENTSPVGSGPFKFEYWRRDEEMKLSRFDDYFQPAKVAGILKVPYANVQGMVNAVRMHQADIAGWGIEPIQGEQLERVDGVDIANVEDFGVYALFYNMRRPLFQYLAVRKALTHAVPKEFFADVLLEGYAVTGKNTLIAPSNKFWHNPDVEQTDFDLKKARQLLEEAGFEWDEEGNIYFPAE